MRLLVVDDSAVMRSLIERMFDVRPDIRIVCKAATTQQAFDFLARERVDVILLDHEMPGQKGLDALPAIIQAGRGAHVVMLSSHCQRGSRTAVKALSLGASEAIAKPTSKTSIPAFAQQLADHLERLVDAAPIAKKADTDHYVSRPFPEDFDLRCIGIGASTGGIHGLSALLGGGSARFGVPVMITQHLPTSFIPYYAQQVERMCDLPVRIAQEGQRLMADTIYIAPGEASLGCRRKGGAVYAELLHERDVATRSLPSVNMMFTSIAKCFGDGALGIVLTGIGRDGTAGAKDIVQSGGVILAQDQESSVVWGMPGSVSRSGLTTATLRPGHMIGYIGRHIGRQVGAGQ